MGEARNRYKILVQNSEGKRTLEKPKPRRQFGPYSIECLDDQPLKGYKEREKRERKWGGNEVH
jgi:hypothetical protein